MECPAPSRPLQSFQSTSLDTVSLLVAQKLRYTVEVDQSGKIEDTATDTVLAFSDGESFAILIPARVKRRCLRELRRRGRRGKSIYWLLFATGLFLLLKDHVQKFSLVIIDVEYTGHGPTVKGHLLNLLRRAGLPADPYLIQFRRVGRRSPAHDRAYHTHRGDVKPDRVVGAEEILREFK